MAKSDIIPRLDGINHITLAVIDIDKSFNFYKDILGFKAICKWQDGAYFLIGNNWFCLNVDENRIANPCYTHYAFSVTKTHFSAMSEQIINSGVTIFKNNQSPGDSLYFLDPDGHKLEIHTSSWQTRIKAKKLNCGSWQDVTWYI